MPRRSIAALAAVLHATAECFAIVSRTGIVTHVSDAAAVLLGRATSTIVGSTMSSLEESAEVRIASRTPVDLDGGEFGEFVVLRAGTLASVFDAGGARLELERLGTALATADLGDFTWNARTDVVTLSARAGEIFDIPSGPYMTWTSMQSLLHPEDRDRVRIAVERAVEARRRYRAEYRLVNGARERWVAASGIPRYAGDGAVVGMHGVVRDVTDERFLVHVDDALRTLFRADDINGTAARMLGEHLAVNRCAYCFVLDDEDGVILTGNYTNGAPSIVGTYTFRDFGAACLRAMRAGDPWVVSDATVDPRLDDAERRTYAATKIRAAVCVPIRKGGDFVAAMAVHSLEAREFRDDEVELVQRVASRAWESIERARVESERERLLAAAEAANRAKDEFFAMLGHELRNPLAPIKTALDLMKLRGDTSGERERTLIERQVAHLTRLVDDLLDVSRIARGTIELERELVALDEIVGRALEVASPLIEARSHTVTVNVPADIVVDGDPARLVQVVSNLLTNAAKYTPAHGHVEVEALVLSGEAVLTVRDDGIGMTEDELPRIFETFVQAQQAIDRAQGGLGLGLTIVKSLVERHGGTVVARSEGRGRGSVLEVRLPLADAGRASRIPETTGGRAEAPSRASTLRVLLVDDNEDAVEMLGMVLEMRGHTVVLAHDGAEALVKAASAPFDAALLDIGLPVMDGYELAGKLAELPTMRGATLVALTGYGQASDRARALAAGFAHHLVKPVDLRVVDGILAVVGEKKRESGG